MKETSPSTTATCSSAISGTSHDLSTLFGGTDYVSTAYSDAECAEAIASAAFTTDYVAQVRATNSVGDSVWSRSSASVEAGTPDPPTAPALTTPGAGQVTAIWTVPADNGSAITDYDIRYSSDGGTTWTTLEMDAAANTARSYTIASLAQSTPYQVQVRAANARGDSGWSPTTTLATLTAGNVMDTTATLTFAAGSHTGNWYLKKTAPAPAGTCSAAISCTTQNLSSLYKVQFSEALCPDWTDWHTVQPTTTASFSHIEFTGPDGNVRVRAYRTTGGVTIYSAWVE